MSFDLAEKSGALVYGVDFNPENIKIARENYGHSNIVYHLGNALEIQMDMPFDTVILSNVLEHLQHRPEFLRDAVEKIRPSRILLRVPIFERDWRVPLKEELGIDYRLDPTHLTEYTQESFMAEMKEANLAIVHLESRWGEIWAEVTPNKPGVSDELKTGGSEREGEC